MTCRGSLTSSWWTSIQRNGASPLIPSPVAMEQSDTPDPPLPCWRQSIRGLSPLGQKGIASSLSSRKINWNIRITLQLLPAIFLLVLTLFILFYSFFFGGEGSWGWQMSPNSGLQVWWQKIAPKGKGVSTWELCTILQPTWSELYVYMCHSQIADLQCDKQLKGFLVYLKQLDKKTNNFQGQLVGRFCFCCE